jgi:sialidase-1
VVVNITFGRGSGEYYSIRSSLPLVILLVGIPQDSDNIQTLNMKLRYIFLFLCVVCCTTLTVSAGYPLSIDSLPGVRKLRDVVIYEDARFHSAFPSVVKRKDGTIMVAFRRAPNRKVFSEKGTNHVDPNSYLVMVTSKDAITWQREPSVFYAHAFGGSQDPCLLQLRDGTLLCTSYGWAFVRPDGIANLRKPYSESMSGVVFLGGYLLRSQDGGKSWDGPHYPPHIEPEINYSATGEPLAAYNRGALYEGKNGRIYWVVAASDSDSPNKKTSNHLLISDDKGASWTYSAPVAVHESISFNEASVYETPKGDIVAFLRTAGMDGQACIARSTDGGKTFQWKSMGFKGYPLHALRLPDDRVLVTYGYRFKPYGIRARILNSECTDFDTAPEIVIRDDAGTTDIGYPWAVMLDKKKVLVTSYFSVNGGPQHIAGTILELTK